MSFNSFTQPQNVGKLKEVLPPLCESQGLWDATPVKPTAKTKNPASSQAQKERQGAASPRAGAEHSPQHSVTPQAPNN